MKRTKNMVYNPTTESNELFLYATNDGNIYRRMVSPIIDNMKRKLKKGIYDKNKAVDAWYSVATEASNQYFKEFGYRFTVTERFTAAIEMADIYEEEILFGF
jgi:hypothetical protein